MLLDLAFFEVIFKSSRNVVIFRFLLYTNNQFVSLTFSLRFRGLQVLYKSRCDNRYNEITERVSGDKREVYSLCYLASFMMVVEIQFDYLT